MIFNSSVSWLQRRQEIFDLFEDFRDGTRLLTLLEVLCQQVLVCIECIDRTMS